MVLRRRAKITVELDRLGYTTSKYFIGTEDEVYEEAHYWMYEVALRFIAEENIDDPFEQGLVIESASHMIEWDDSLLTMFAVCESDCTDPIMAAFPAREDAEEFILSEAEDWAYRIMMTEPPEEVFGTYEYDWYWDYRYLLLEASKSMYIQEFPVFNIKEID